MNKICFFKNNKKRSIDTKELVYFKDKNIVLKKDYCQSQKQKPKRFTKVDIDNITFYDRIINV